LKALISGNVCAVVSALLNPFDVTKIRMQNQSKSNGIVYKGMIDGAFSILREEGITGWCRGMTASMMREITYSSIRLGAYEPIRNILNNISSNNDNTKHTSPFVRFSAALITGGVGAAIANPLDLIKTRFQACLPTEQRPYKNTFDAFRIIYSFEGGFKGLYKGWIVTSSRSAILTSSQLGAYDSIKHNLLLQKFKMKEGLTVHLVSSLLAGLCTTTATIPFDVIKTRYMSDNSNKYKGILDCVKSSYATDGPKSFFRGWLPAYCRLGPHTVLSFLLIEYIRAYMNLSPI
jgi:hypothetical protein